MKNDKIQILKKDNSNSAYWIYSLLVDNKKKFRKFLKKHGIETDEVHIRNDKYSVFKSHSLKKLTGTDLIDKKMLNVPVGWWLKTNDIKYITKIINSY